VDPDEEVLVEQEELQSLSHRELQSVVQSVVVLEAHCVEQSDSHDDVQLASAVVVHWESHCCSSWAAHACSHEVGAHWVVQFCCVTMLHDAEASMLKLPQAETVIVSADASRANAESAPKASAATRGERRARVTL
jgi:hypothetical protein